MTKSAVVTSFMSRHAPVPLRVVAAHIFGGGFERMTTIELNGRDPPGSISRVNPANICIAAVGACEEHLRDMTASLHAAHRVVQRLAKTVQQAGADELAIRRRI